MKLFFLISAFILLSTQSFSQAFHFDLTERTLIKTVNQSPAHWYLEIFNDVGVDTTLRWKSYFTNIPTQWDINFDDQNTNYTLVQSGDSADFTLYAPQVPSQKLIIGAEFNGTPGTGSTFFDIYNPADPSWVVTIRFKFIVSAVGLTEQQADDWIKQKGTQFEFGDVLVGNEIQLTDLDGKIIFDGTIEEKMDFEQLQGDGIIVLTILNLENSYSRKIILK